MIAHRKAIKLLEKAGYFLKRHGGNHDIYFNAELRRAIPLKRHGFDKNDLRYIEKEIELGERR
ncbi:MAG: type II toxin-antitoxin system HicA family toxin [Spirochaetia bacterium]|nr:type II toxin-antitoxin system HicA family toxin [Spirochaetia bacterium]MBR5928075.1 type II toxin-antitoxin system HicA family toxin [Spirochaetia bacterium]